MFQAELIKHGLSVCVCEIEGQRLFEYCCAEDWEMQHVFPLMSSQLRERERGEKWEGGEERGAKISRHINVLYVNINTRVTRREMRMKPSVIKTSFARAICRDGMCALCTLHFLLRNMDDLLYPAMQCTWLDYSMWAMSYSWLILIRIDENICIIFL